MSETQIQTVAVVEQPPAVEPTPEQKRIAALEQQVATLERLLKEGRELVTEHANNLADANAENHRLLAEAQKAATERARTATLNADLQAEKARLLATVTETGKPVHRYAVTHVGLPDEVYGAVDESEAARLYRLKYPKSANLLVRRLD